LAEISLIKKTITKMEHSKFKPKEHLTFKQGADKITKALEEVKVNFKSQIFTSRDEVSVKLANLLQVKEVPDGFKKWQLPIVLTDSQLFISIAQPDIKVPEHSHDEGDGIRFIMSGSIYYDGQELTAGDWMYIPKGKPYSMRIGPFGASMCYCYCCCCAGSSMLDRRDWVVNPADYVRKRGHQM
jgi:hypothetical protein